MGAFLEKHPRPMDVLQAALNELQTSAGDTEKILQVLESHVLKSDLGQAHLFTYLHGVIQCMARREDFTSIIDSLTRHVDYVIALMGKVEPVQVQILCEIFLDERVPMTWDSLFFLAHLQSHFRFDDHSKSLLYGKFCNSPSLSSKFINFVVFDDLLETRGQLSPRAMSYLVNFLIIADDKNKTMGLEALLYAVGQIRPDWHRGDLLACLLYWSDFQVRRGFLDTNFTLLVLQNVKDHKLNASFCFHLVEKFMRTGHVHMLVALQACLSLLPKDDTAKPQILQFLFNETAERVDGNQAVSLYEKIFTGNVGVFPERVYAHMCRQLSQMYLDPLRECMTFPLDLLAKLLKRRPFKDGDNVKRQILKNLSSVSVKHKDLVEEIRKNLLN